jgi:hypothetical protein
VKREAIMQNILIREKLGFTEPVMVLVGIRENRDEEFILLNLPKYTYYVCRKRGRINTQEADVFSSEWLPTILCVFCILSLY